VSSDESAGVQPSLLASCMSCAWGSAPNATSFIKKEEIRDFYVDFLIYYDGKLLPSS